ncbi:nucleoside deaminase [Aureimonas fodinaquatilis]|uniref:Nucleoside deaminase n=1 Tax=Aureimonas fodinaquatilis TaxID=2565783 RepID=A0A5B0DV23_9HYPH|nr:nucleoside deaminase [Aureimonas fodinaquatilis]KAA0969049.1 nucleoside deaminase [Aureimonas fodinaquatilis]
MESDQRFLQEAIELARDNVDRGGRPFGSVIVRDGEVIAAGVNEVIQSGDVTAHAEMVAVRNATTRQKLANLAGTTVYASGHPCPMCMAAMRLTGVKRVVFAYSNEDGTPYGLSSAALYAEQAKPFAEQTMMQIEHQPAPRNDGPDLYDYWKARQP